MYLLIAQSGPMSSHVLDTDSGQFVPVDDTSNVDTQRYVAWLAAGNRPTLAPPPPAQVPTCALWQLEAVMTAAQLAAAEAAVAALDNPAVTAFWKQGTNSIPANSATLVALGTAMGLDADQVAALVAAAAKVAIA